MTGSTPAGPRQLMVQARTPRILRIPYRAVRGRRQV